MAFIIRLYYSLRSIKNSFRRFPITIVISTLLVIMIIILSEIEVQLSQGTIDALERINMVLALGIPLTLCLKLIYEKQRPLGVMYKSLGYIFGAAILIIYYFLFLKNISMVSLARYIGVSISLYLAFIYIPWIGKKDGYEFYIITTLFDFFLTVIYSVVLYLGISVIIFTINQLFNAGIPGKYFYYTFLIISGIFAPSLFLARIPEINKNFKDNEYPRSFKILLLYIIIPLISIYSIILYTYFIRIIVTRSWPRGLVSHLVLWYSVLSVAVIFFITPILDRNKPAHRFKYWFPRFALPVLILMFISMGIRVREYGITENRYFAIILGIWVLAMMLYNIFAKKLKNIIIPVSLSIVALNSVFGPLSSFSISKLSQSNRLKTILIRNNMFENNEIHKVTGNISTEDKNQISAVLDYFDANHSLADVKYLQPNFKIESMDAVFGFPYTEKNVFRDAYFYYYSEGKSRIMDIRGYDYFLEGYGITGGIEIENNVVISYNEIDNVFTIMKNNELIYKTNLMDYALTIIEDNGGIDLKSNIINPGKEVFIGENDRVKVKFFINSISGERPDSASMILSNIDYYVLIKFK